MDHLTGFESSLLRIAGSILSRTGRGGRALVTLTYHRVLPAADPMLHYEPDARSFKAQMDLLAANFRVLPLTEAAERLKSASLPDRALCITFDDGYVNNLTVAEPILAERNLTATVFVATGYLGGGRMFNDTVIEAVRQAPAELDLRPLGLGRLSLPDIAARQKAVRTLLEGLKYRPAAERVNLSQRIAEMAGAKLPNDLMMDESQVRKLYRSGIEIGAHTVSHPILAGLDPELAAKEIRDSKRTLEEMIGARVSAFAYPNGRPITDYSSAHARMAAEAGFSVAVSTAWGAATRATDLFQLPRIAPWDKRAKPFGARIVRAYSQRAFDTAA
jgi:peptidoglycan/xylan/chitin deacetylase (PgdA/CDA1 family)